MIILQDNIEIYGAKLNNEMKHLRKATIILMTALGFVFLLESCAAGKNCGCGNDLNRNYTLKKRR